MSGFVDVYFGYNFNTPSTRQAQVRNFDIQHNSFSLNLAEVALEKKPTADSRAGFRVDLDYGPTATMVSAAEPGGTQTFQNILQAYASYLAPLGHGLQFDIGKFVTPIGNEVIKTRDNWNYSRSLLFTLAEPYYHAGVRVSYSVNDHFSLSGLSRERVEQRRRQQRRQDGRRAGDAETIGRTHDRPELHGRPGTGERQRRLASSGRHGHHLHGHANREPRDELRLRTRYGGGLDGDVARRGGIPAVPAEAWFAFTPRAEYYDDPNGSTTGVIQKIKEITLTTEFKHKDGVLLRVEYRRDMSDTPFFQKNVSSLVKHQDTLTVGIVYAFSSRCGSVTECSHA